MKTTHNSVANATYYLLDETAIRKVAKTVPVSDFCNVDIDLDGYPIGVEILHPFKKIPPSLDEG